MNRFRPLLIIAFTLIAGLVLAPRLVCAQPYGVPDSEAPGDAMFQAYLAAEAKRLDAQFDEDLVSLERLQERIPQYRREYLQMLGLWPLPDRTALEPTVTGTVDGDGFTVEKLHYQSMPGLYVTANLYRPSEQTAGQRLPTVLYVCGHSNRGRDGNKTAYQSHGIWLAKHGYVCLVLDTLQLGEIAAVHHGTYREERWWWHGRGYTSAGVECWNGMRGIDYLIGRDDVDPERIAVTGISGGGAATFWIAAADERVAVAVPVSGMADLESYVGNRVINGHCDCMFLHNSFAWPWTRIAALIAPRPMLFVNSDADAIFPMDANERISNRLERLYSLYGAGDQFETVVSIGGHAYREDIRRATYRFLNTHLKGDPSPVTDSEQDLVIKGETDSHPIPTERLRVFADEADLPRRQTNTTIDQQFVPLAQWELPAPEGFLAWQAQRLADLHDGPFRALASAMAAAQPVSRDGDWEQVETEPGITISLQHVKRAASDTPKRVLLVVRREEESDREPDWIARLAGPGDRVVICDPRGIGGTRFTQQNPPNFVERAHVLLGQTVDTGRVRDVAAVAAYLRENASPPEASAPVHVVGRGSAGIVAAYAAVLSPHIASVTLIDPPATHMSSDAPQFLSILRVGDVPELLGLLAPKPLEILEVEQDDFAATAAAYDVAGAADQLSW